MKKYEVTLNLIESNQFTVNPVQYKYKEDQRKYGVSFEALAKTDKPVTCIVNGEQVQAHRIIEEYGQLLFIHNFKQREYSFDEVVSLEIL